MGAFKGDADADATRTLVLLRLGEVPGTGPVMRMVVNGVRSWMRRTYLRRYIELRRDVDPRSIRQWMAVIAAARLREGIEAEKAATLRLVEASLRETVP
jgi:hypothetical protein